MVKNSKTSYISKLTDAISKLNSASYDDFPNYELFLSQVIDVLNDKFNGEEFTPHIVQNYIKHGVITRPEEGKKRGYTKTHLIQLMLLGHMRPVLSKEEIKKVFNLAFNEINDNSDDILSWEETFKIFTLMQEESFNHNLITNLNYEARLEKIIKKLDLKGENEEQIAIFLLVLTLISQASAIKKLVQKIVEEYIKE